MLSCPLCSTGKNIVFPAWILYNDPRLITTKSTVNFVNSLSTWEILGSTWDRCTKPRVNPGLGIRYFFLCSSDLPTEPLLLQHIRVCHSWDPNFSIQCIVRGCCRTFGNYRTFQNHLLKHGSHTTVPVTTQECISIDNVEAADTVPLNTQSTIANLEAVASTSIEDQPVTDYGAKWILQMSEKHRLTREAMIDIVSSTIDLLSYTTDNFKHKFHKILTDEGIVQDDKLKMIGEMLGQEMTNPLKGLDTFQKQLTYYRTHYGFLVSYH